METPNVPTKSQVEEVHHVLMLQEPIPETPMRDVIKVIGLGLAIAVGQFAVLVCLLGWAAHR
jgi:hypothetical protein